MTNEESTIEYSPSTFDIKHGVGDKFMKDFMKTHKLGDLKAKTELLVKKSKDSVNKPLVISFCSEKGGCGKTTVAMCMSQIFANIGFKVLVVDLDNLESSHLFLNSRKKRLLDFITESQESGVPEQQVIEAKSKIDPLVESVRVDTGVFNSSYIDELCNDSKFDIIIFDSAGGKGKRTQNFNVKDLNATGAPHVSLAYKSNLVIIPMRVTPIDINLAINFYFPLQDFLRLLEATNKQEIRTQYRLLANSMERTGSGKSQLEDFREGSFKLFNTALRRSEKIAFALDLGGVGTVFTTKVAMNMQQGLIDVTKEVIDDIEVSLGV